MNILITGAGSGIGHDAAFALAKRGHSVLATTHTLVQAEKLAGEAKEKGIALRTSKLDVTSSADIQALSAEVFDALILNAGVGESGPVSEIPMERFRAMAEVNIFGTVQVLQAFVHPMVAKKGGRVIIVSSLAGRLVIPFLGAYSMTKFALEAMGDALRLELAPHGISTSLVEPGLIYTGFNERMASTKYSWLKRDSVIADFVPKLEKLDASLPSRSSGTSSVVRSICHAVESNRPKARYIAPWSYRPIFALLHFLPARVKDWVVSSALGV